MRIVMAGVTFCQRGMPPQTLNRCIVVRLGLVATISCPGPSIKSFVSHHIAIGFQTLFLFHEGEPDCHVLETAVHQSVTLIRSSSYLRQLWRALPSYPVIAPHLDKEVMARQILNAELGVELARESGVDWLFHLDADELMHPQTGTLTEQLMAAESAGVEHMVYANHEAVPPTETVADCFREVTTFKANPDIIPSGDRKLFIAYYTGKAAVRLSTNPIAHGVHRFRRADKTRLRTARSKTAAVLHYPSCGLEQYFAKYRRLGAFDEQYFGKLSIAANMPFHWQSRNLISANKLDEARQLYRDRVMLANLSAAEQARLLDTRVLVRIQEPAHRLTARATAGETR